MRRVYRRKSLAVLLITLRVKNDSYVTLVTLRYAEKNARVILLFDFRRTLPLHGISRSDYNPVLGKSYILHSIFFFYLIASLITKDRLKTKYNSRSPRPAFEKSQSLEAPFFGITYRIAEMLITLNEYVKYRLRRVVPPRRTKSRGKNVAGILVHNETASSDSPRRSMSLQFSANSFCA